jgi:hypothetical protein
VKHLVTLDLAALSPLMAVPSLTRSKSDYPLPFLLTFYTFNFLGYIPLKYFSGSPKLFDRSTTVFAFIDLHSYFWLALLLMILAFSSAGPLFPD